MVEVGIELISFLLHTQCNLVGSVLLVRSKLPVPCIGEIKSNLLGRLGANGLQPTYRLGPEFIFVLRKPLTLCSKEQTNDRNT